MASSSTTVSDTHFVIGPNASLSVRGAWWFMGALSAATLGCATFCVILGFWPVLPFAGLELAAVGWGLAVSIRRNRYREVVSFSDEQVRIEFGAIGQGPAAQIDFPRAWARAWIERDAEQRHRPTRLVLGCSGQKVVVGRCLTDEEREQLVKRFKWLLQARLPQGAGLQQAGMTLGEG